MRFRSAVLVGLVASSMGCATAGLNTAIPAPSSPQSAAIIPVPFQAQEAYQCGPAALAMLLDWSGLDTAPGDLIREIYTPGRKGSLQPDLVAAARRHGRVAYLIDDHDELLAELAAANPVLVLQNLGLSWLPQWHYAVVIGHDANTGVFVLHSGRDALRPVAESTFEHTWKRAGSWGLLALPPARIPATADENRWLDAVVGLEQAGQFEAAATAYSAAITRWPDSLAARIGLANTEYGAGNFDAAETALRAAIAAHPNAAVACNNLAQLLHERGRDAEALVVARRAVALGGPDIDVYKETLATIEESRR